jgi:CubicO group peptidase (beta-lactamase class C family)
MSALVTVQNPDLLVGADNKSAWTRATDRRRGLHNLHRIARYVMSFRAAQVLPLEPHPDQRIADLPAVRHYTALPCFSAMVVVRATHILFERYAPDFGPDRPHSIQSITKTILNLNIGQLADSKVLDLSNPVQHYLPEIGSGYSDATLQQVLNMDVANEYTEDFADPTATYFAHEEAMGWRLPMNPNYEQTQKRFISQIRGDDIINRSGHIQYKDANSDVLGWVAERASGRPLRAFLADIADASGLEHAVHITTDREGFPTLDGGGCLTARDLARYFSIFVRHGRGVNAEVVGSEAFIAQTLQSGVPRPAPNEHLLYSNHLCIEGRSLSHSGWAGQCAMANLDTGIVGVFISVLENTHGVDRDYFAAVSSMLSAVTSMDANEP